jgi:hypothetical protein
MEIAALTRFYKAFLQVALQGSFQRRTDLRTPPAGIIR